MPPNRLVRFLRIELGISEAELGSRVEMTQSAISKLERSCEGASISVIRRLLRATNCELVLWAEPHRSFKLERMRWAEARFLMARRLYDEGKRRRPSEFSEMDP
ncbi:MAG: helix-turn-helix transcriptional regulator [Proteobacteria bacterium]|nr:helix-turn-helix transcriptional regulator [Pseudomonadota bacterium]